MTNSAQRNIKSSPRIERRRDVQDRTGLSRSTIYDLMDAGDFPRPIRLGPRAVGWLSHEVDEWIEDRRTERDAGGRP
jgi:prophage regulatory protein